MNKKFLSTTLIATVMALTTGFAYAQMLPPPEESGKCPHFEKQNHKMMHEKRKEQIEAFEKRLNLTDEQKAAIEKNRKSAKIKLDKIRQKEMKLREERREILKQNKKDFEALLTPEQKEELKKIEQERKAHFEKMKQEHQKRIQKLQQAKQAK